MPAEEAIEGAAIAAADGQEPGRDLGSGHRRRRVRARIAHRPILASRLPRPRRVPLAGPARSARSQVQGNFGDPIGRNSVALRGLADGRFVGRFIDAVSPRDYVTVRQLFQRPIGKAVSRASPRAGHGTKTRSASSPKSAPTKPGTTVPCTPEAAARAPEAVSPGTIPGSREPTRAGAGRAGGYLDREARPPAVTGRNMKSSIASSGAASRRSRLRSAAPSQQSTSRLARRFTSASGGMSPCSPGLFQADGQTRGDGGEALLDLAPEHRAHARQLLPQPAEQAAHVARLPVALLRRLEEATHPIERRTRRVPEAGVEAAMDVDACTGRRPGARSPPWTRSDGRRSPSESRSLRAAPGCPGRCSRARGAWRGRRRACVAWWNASSVGAAPARDAAAARAASPPSPSPSRSYGR